MNSQHLEDEGEAAQHAVGLGRQLDGQRVDGGADQQAVDEVGLAVAARRAALPPGVGRVVVALQLHQDLAGVDHGGRRGQRQRWRRGGDGDGGGWVGRGSRRRLRRAGGGGRQGQEGGWGWRGRLWAEQAQRHGRLAVVLLLAAVPDLLQAGGVVPTAGGGGEGEGQTR